MTTAKAEPAAEVAAPKKKGLGMMTKLMAGVALIGAGGGTAYGLMLKGVIGDGHEAKQDNLPKLVRKGEEDAYAPAGEGHGAEGGGIEIEGEGGEPYRTSYYSFSDEFTSNLRGSGHFMQTSLAASTNYDGRVLLWLKKHELAIRSAILIVLADTSEEEAYSVAGKERLQKRLADAINKILVTNEGFGGVKAVHFKSYIVQ